MASTAANEVQHDSHVLLLLLLLLLLYMQGTVTQMSVRQFIRACLLRPCGESNPVSRVSSRTLRTCDRITI